MNILNINYGILVVEMEWEELEVSEIAAFLRTIAFFRNQAE